MCNVQKNNVSSDAETVKELERVLYGGKRFGNHVDEVWPNLFIADMSAANDRYGLWKLGITHVLNVAHGKAYCQADDSTHFDLNVYFKPAADFIHKALKTSDGKVLVHCIMGMSRSSTLVLAYLMLYHHIPLRHALQEVVKKRAVYPNRNFLALLLDLDLQLRGKRKACVIL
ncbi:dual specificity protein phosphatase 13-like isoform X2 [Hypomesus transpacificus]|uniref:dual specificity protein phosphatase 13-like isoform X2 n=1 Tax=Hypomesus transpacificus TaxID=137520 RepID=UPI001F079E2C|nr:dual specificity protein phosphatase 13-like isoform X2 [Hypomesus transpacificus]